MDRKNINRGFKKLRVWQDAVSLYITASKIFTDFPFELKKVAANPAIAGLPIASQETLALLNKATIEICDYYLLQIRHK
jgi:hypothetical protein